MRHSDTTGVSVCVYAEAKCLAREKKDEWAKKKRKQRQLSRIEEDDEAKKDNIDVPELLIFNIKYKCVQVIWRANQILA